MTESEALEKLKANLECQKKQVYGRYEDCNSDKCDDCELCYKQGNNGERIESTKIAIQALEKQIPKKPLFNHNLSDTLSVFRCECGSTIKVSHDVGIMDNNNAPDYCSDCGCRLDWSDDNDD